MKRKLAFVGLVFACAFMIAWQGYRTSIVGQNGTFFGNLTVNGNATITGTSTLTGAVAMGADLTVNDRITRSGDANTYIELGPNDDEMTLKVGDDTAMFIDEDGSPTVNCGTVYDWSWNANTFFVGGADGSYTGKVGVNTATPACSLDVVGTLGVSDKAVIPLLNYLADTSSANDTYGGTMAPAPAAYTTGTVVVFVSAVANTGACTLAFNGLTVKNIKTASGADPANNDIVTTTVSLLVYDGTNWVLINPATTCD